jgi:hypothetical protein
VAVNEPPNSEKVTSFAAEDQFSTAKSTTSPAAASPSRMSTMPIGHLPSRERYLYPSGARLMPPLSGIAQDESGAIA